MAQSARVALHRTRHAQAKPSSTKERRIDLRIQPEAKEIIQKAADLMGMSVSSFLVFTGLKAARAELAGQNETKLSDRDRDLFLRALDSPPAPNAALKAAMSRFRRQA
jgi:uncharacterized protein (DUF1778 family)